MQPQQIKSEIQNFFNERKTNLIDYDFEFDTEDDCYMVKIKTKDHFYYFDVHGEKECYSNIVNSENDEIFSSDEELSLSRNLELIDKFIKENGKEF